MTEAIQDLEAITALPKTLFQTLSKISKNFSRALVPIQTSAHKYLKPPETITCARTLTFGQAEFIVTSSITDRMSKRAFTLLTNFSQVELFIEGDQANEYEIHWVKKYQEAAIPTKKHNKVYDCSVHDIGFVLYVTIVGKNNNKEVGHKTINFGEVSIDYRLASPIRDYMNSSETEFVFRDVSKQSVANEEVRLKLKDKMCTLYDKNDQLILTFETAKFELFFTPTSHTTFKVQLSKDETKTIRASSESQAQLIVMLFMINSVTDFYTKHVIINTANVVYKQLASSNTKITTVENEDMEKIIRPMFLVQNLLRSNYDYAYCMEQLSQTNESMKDAYDSLNQEFLDTIKEYNNVIKHVQGNMSAVSPADVDLTLEIQKLKRELQEKHKEIQRLSEAVKIFTEYQNAMDDSNKLEF